MTEQDLNITTINELSITFKDDFKELMITKFPDGTMEFNIEDYHDSDNNYGLSKAQNEYLLKWWQGEGN